MAKAQQKEYWKKQYQLKQEGLPMTGQQQRRCVLLFGPSAVGKTTEVKTTAYGEYDEELYEKAGNNKWFEGYNGENHVLFDELRKAAFDGSLETFNSMTNIGCIQVEYKGGSTVLQAEHLYFTSNWHPTDIWNSTWADGKYRAMARRHAEVHWWNDAKNKVVLENPGEEPVTDDQEIIDGWNEKNERWMSFWKGRNRPIQEGDSAVPDQDEMYFTFGCNQ